MTLEPAPSVHPEPTLGELAMLAESVDIRERAFVASALVLRRGREDHDALDRIYQRVRATSARVHRAVRERIREKTLERAAFVAELSSLPLELRDHWVEEILDLAYPPLDLPAPPRELVTNPSGMSEILFLLEHAELGPERTFVDLGSGSGKVVLLVALLSGARAWGIELLPELVAQAEAAASALALDNARFQCGDMLEVPLPAGDVYYLFMPGPRPANAVARLASVARERSIRVFSQRLDLERFPWLERRNAGSYWLELYEAVRSA